MHSKVREMMEDICRPFIASWILHFLSRLNRLLTRRADALIYSTSHTPLSGSKGVTDAPV